MGRFIQQDPIGDGMNWYAYAENNPLVYIDPEGLEITIPGLSGQPWLVFGEEAKCQLGMSAGATASGLVAGLTGGLVRPKWENPCDQYAGFSKAMGKMSGAALLTAGLLAGAEGAGFLKYPEHAGGFEFNFGKNFRVGWGRFHIKAGSKSRYAGRTLNRLHYHRRPGIGKHRPWQGW